MKTERLANMHRSYFEGLLHTFLNTNAGEIETIPLMTISASHSQEGFVNSIIDAVGFHTQIFGLSFKGNKNLEPQLMVFGMKKSQTNVGYYELLIYEQDFALHAFRRMGFRKDKKIVTDVESFSQRMTFCMAGLH